MATGDWFQPWVSMGVYGFFVQDFDPFKSCNCTAGSSRKMTRTWHSSNRMTASSHFSLCSFLCFLPDCDLGHPAATSDLYCTCAGKTKVQGKQKKLPEVKKFSDSRYLGSMRWFLGVQLFIFSLCRCELSTKHCLNRFIGGRKMVP